MTKSVASADPGQGILSPQQIRFFETFGFLVLRGHFAQDIQWMTEEFLACFEDFEVDHDGSERSTVIPFIDHRERLRALLEHPKVAGVFAALLGEDWNYLSSDGNLFSGSTPWHPDVSKTTLTFIKMAIYLDPVTAQSGALRVIPGSHNLSDATAFGYAVREGVRTPGDWWQIEEQHVPSVILETAPGDATLMNENIVHGSWGGSAKRRQFTVNAFSHVETDDQARELREVISLHSPMWMDTMHSEEMVRTAPVERMRRLQQVLDHQDHLPALTADARKQMPRPVMNNQGWHAPRR